MTPDAANTGAHVSANERPSGFVKRSVRTSLGFSFRNVTTFSRYAGVTSRKGQNDRTVGVGRYRTCDGSAIE